MLAIDEDITQATVFEINSEAINKIYLFKNRYGEEGEKSEQSGDYKMADESICLVELTNGESISFCSSEWGFIQILQKRLPI